MESHRSSGCAFTLALHSFKYRTTMNFIETFSCAASILKDFWLDCYKCNIGTKPNKSLNKNSNESFLFWNNFEMKVYFTTKSPIDTYFKKNYIFVQFRDEKMWIEG